MFTIQTTQRYFLLLLTIMLVACQPETIGEVPTSTASVVSATQTLTALPSVTISPTELPLFPFDGYVTVFQKEGDLYFQDENNPPIQLTQGADSIHSPIISGDDEKIAYFRGEETSGSGYSNLYLVNTDGTNDHVIVTSGWLAKFGDGTRISSSRFIPNTHQLLVYIFFDCHLQDYSSCTTDFFLVNTDTDEMVIFENPQQKTKLSRHVSVSRDGKFLAVSSSGQIDIFDIQGEIISGNILPYTPSSPIEIFPEIHWLSDSQELLIALPNLIHAGAPVPPNIPYTVWRYSIQSSKALKVLLEPPLVLSFLQCQNVLSLSQDRNWALYNSVNGDLYLWNTLSGVSEIYDSQMHCFDGSWGPGNKYFEYENHGLGSIDGPPIQIHGIFQNWIDSTHFTYAVLVDAKTPKIVMAEIVDNTILTYDLPGTYFLIEPKR